MPREMSAQFRDSVDNAPARAVSLDELEHAAVHAGVAYWRALKAGRKMPARSQLSPRDMAGILRNIVLVKVLDGGKDYEYRIAGDAHVQAFTVPFRNLRLSNLVANAPALGRTLHSLFERVRATGAPHAIRGCVDKNLPEARFSYFEFALLPLGEDGETVDHVLAAAIYVPTAHGLAV